MAGRSYSTASHAVHAATLRVGDQVELGDAVLVLTSQGAGTVRLTLSVPRGMAVTVNGRAVGE